MAFNGQLKRLHILTGLFSLNIPYLEGKMPFADEEQSCLGDMLPETSKSSAFWDMGVNSHLKWLLLFSPDEAASRDSTSL